MMALTSCHPGKITWCWCGKWQGILQHVEFNLSCGHSILKNVYQMKSMEVFCRHQLTSASIRKLTVSPTYLILIVSPTCHSFIPTNDGVGFGICFFRILSLASSATGAFESALSPYYTWSDHALPVTDIHCGCGGMRGHVITSSLDQTCKVKFHTKA